MPNDAPDARKHLWKVFITYTATGWTALDIEFLNTRRKAHIRIREEFLGFKKTCGKDLARFFGGEEKRVLKSIRGAEIALQYMRGEIGCIWRIVPLELVDEVLHELGCTDYGVAVRAEQS